jgi:acid phosphatase
MARDRRFPYAVLLAGVALGAVGARWALALAEAEPAPKKEAVAFPMEARLGANLWMENSAEYRACCLQIYRCAQTRLEALLADSARRPPRPAVVMDLDETVFDNSAFQSFLYHERLEYTQALWDYYEKSDAAEVRLVPGAKRFIAFAESQGVAVIYISNRGEPFRDATIAALKSNGLDLTGIHERLFLKPENGSSDKAARRELVEARYNVMMFFGDNLRDFSEAFAAPKMEPNASRADLMNATDDRLKAADAAAVHWGVDWFVLPNPCYGEWEKLLGNNPKSLLRLTRLVLKK